MKRILTLLFISMLGLSASIATLGLSASTANAVQQKGMSMVEQAQKTAEGQLRRLIEPLLEKYCHEQCKLLTVSVNVDIASGEELAPGFDEFSSPEQSILVPSSGTMKLLVSNKVGPNTRRDLLEMVQQHLDNLDYPVKVEAQTVNFPQPIGSEGKISELREKLARQFHNILSDVISQYCPEQCLVTDFNLQTEEMNVEEAKYSNPGEFVQDGSIAVKAKDISATLLMDEALDPLKRGQILNMAKLRTEKFRNVTITPKAFQFPKPAGILDGEEGIGPDGGPIYGGALGRNGRFKGKMSSEKSELESKTNQQNNTENRSLASTENKTDEKNQTTTHSNNEAKNTSTSEAKNTSNNETKSATTNSNTESTNKQEKFEKYEKIERVENGDAVMAELEKFRFYAMIFGASILALLVFIAMATMRGRKSATASEIRPSFMPMPSYPADPAGAPMAAPSSEAGGSSSQSSSEGSRSRIGKRIQIEKLTEELTAIYAQNPKVAKHVFSRVITEEGIETTAQYIHIFGEGIVVDLLRDPSLQTSLNELMEFYAKNPMELEDDQKLDLLTKLHHRTVASKLVVMGNRSSSLFDFLAEMDSSQIFEMIRSESLTVQSIILTQCDAQKRAKIYANLDEDVRMKLLAELSRIDYLPRDYIYNVSNALKRKRRENPRLNTEALPGSEVLVTLLERTGLDIQRNVLRGLDASNPDSARTVKSKLVSIDTLRFLRDGQLLEVILGLKHDELLQFLKGAPNQVRNVIFSKSPKELVVELEEELKSLNAVSREQYQTIERKILNRLRVMANDGLINLIEVNERMFAENPTESGFVQGMPAQGGANGAAMRRIA